MKSYRNLGIITLIILVLLSVVVHKINTLVLKQLAETGSLQKPIPAPAIKTVEKKEVEPPKIIEGIIIEGAPPAPVTAPKAPRTPA